MTDKAVISISSRKIFEISHSMLETLALQHGAIDPDSGHIVCHHYRLGVALATVGNKAVPLFTIEGCIFITAGRDNVEELLHSTSVVEVDTISLRGGGIEVGDVKLDGYWALLALSFARENGDKLRLFKLEIELDGRREKAVGFLIESKEAQPVMLIVPRSCREEKQQVRTHM